MGLLEWDPDMFAQLSGVYCVCVCWGGGGGGVLPCLNLAPYCSLVHHVRLSRALAMRSLAPCPNF